MIEIQLIFNIELNRIELNWSPVLLLLRA